MLCGRCSSILSASGAMCGRLVVRCRGRDGLHDEHCAAAAEGEGDDAVVLEGLQVRAEPSRCLALALPSPPIPLGPMVRLCMHANVI